jgi:hypothetical protein
VLDIHEHCYRYFFSTGEDPFLVHHFLVHFIFSVADMISEDLILRCPVSYAHIEALPQTGWEQFDHD